MKVHHVAVLHVVESTFGLPKDELVRTVAKLFGFARTSAEMSDRITDVVDTLIENGELRVSGFQIVLGDL